MTVLVYPAIVSSAGPALEARFVDLPAVEVRAESAADLIRLAREALGGELQRLEDAAEVWPEPTALAGLAVPTGATAVLVDVTVEDTPVKLTISIGERLLKRIDEDAAARSMTRSGYLALGARTLLGDGRFAFSGLGPETGKKIQDEIEAVGRRLNDAVGPHSALGRTLADLDARALDGLRRLSDEVRAAMAPKRPRPEANEPNSAVEDVASHPHTDA